MSINNQFVPHLREQRQFPFDDLKQLARQVDEAYIDIAANVNARTIGQFPIGFAAPTGESWFLEGGNKRQQALRQVYTFTAAGSIPHGILSSSISQMTRPFGTFTDGTNYYGAFFASNVAIAGQVTFYVTATNIVILSGAGAPTIVSGTIVLEWLSTY